MTKKKSKRKKKEAKSLRNSHTLRKHTEHAMQQYFSTLNGDKPTGVYDLVIGEVEEPLLRAVLDYTEGNQSQAAGVLGINRGTLRKKLKTYSIIQ